MNSSGDLDITGNIKAIEQIKSDMLMNVAKLYASMAGAAEDSGERLELLAELLILNYKLGQRLGNSYQEIDSKVVNKLKLQVLEGNSFESTSLLKHMDRFRSQLGRQQ